MLKHKDRRAMNLNDFVVLPNSTAKSVKLNARNLLELKLETGSLAQENEEMEEKLKQLRERMSQEKEERAHSGSCKWKSGQHLPLNSATTLINTKNKDSRFQKLSAGKMKIRVLKNEPLTVQPPPSSPAPMGPRTMRKNKLMGTTCGQCEVRTAGIKCAECSEDYCIGCFSKFHQKGALKFHSIIPIQRELKTHVCTQDVVSCLQTQTDPSCYPATFSSPNLRPNSEHNHDALSNEFEDQRPKNAVVAQHMQIKNSHTSQILVVYPEGSNNSEFLDDGRCLLNGTYDEEESSRTFQEALRQWREAGEPGPQEPMWTPPRPATVADVLTQVDLSPSGGGAGRRVPVRVEFSEHSLTFLDRLLLKKHRRTPIELHPPLLDANVKSLQESPEKEEPEPSLTAEDEECHNYLSSLFAVPTNIQRYGLHNSTPEAFMTIEVLDEEDKTMNAEKSIVNRIIPLHQHNLSKQSAGVPSSYWQTTPTPAPKSKLSRASNKTKTVLAVYSALAAKPEPCAHPTTTSTSIKTESKKPTRSQTGYKAKAVHGSPQSPLLSSSAPLYRTQTPKSTYSLLSFSPNDSPSTGRSLMSEECDSYPNISLALRSTFTLTPSSSVDSALLPKISQPLEQSPRGCVISPKQFHHSLLDQDTVQSENQATFPAPLMSPSPSTMSSSSSNSDSPALHSTKSARKSSSLSMSGSMQDVFSRSRLSHDDTHADTAVCLTSEHVTTGHESMSEQHEQQSLLELSLTHSRSPVLTGRNEAMSTGNAKESTFALIQEYHNALKSIQDSEDEMSSDSLNVALCEEDAEVHRRLESSRSRDDRGNPASTHLGDPFVPPDEEGERDLQTDGAEQLSEPSLCIHTPRSGSDLDDLSDDDESAHSGINPILNLQNFDAVHQSRSLQDLSTPTESSHVSRSLSRAAQEILEICDVDQSGCEDPDLEADTTAHTLCLLEEELRLLARETRPEIFTAATGSNRTEDPPGNRLYTRSRMSKEELDEEEAAQNDRNSVLLLP